MGRGSPISTDRALRQLDGYAGDGLAWSDFGAAVIDVLGGVVPHDAVVVSMVDPATGLLTNIVRSGIDDSQDERFMQIELTHPDPITMTGLAGTSTGVGILADHLHGDPYSSPRVRELLGPFFDLEHEMRGVVRSGGRMIAACGVYRGSGRRGFSDDEAIVLSSLEVAIARGVRRAHATTQAGRSADPHVAPSGPAVVILDPDGRVREMTPMAQARMALLGGQSATGVPHAVRMVAAAVRAQRDVRTVSPAAASAGSTDGGSW